MDVPIGMCKPDPAGKSTGSFNGETCDETTRSQSPDFTLPGKTSKENIRCPYHKPTQVDKENIHRRSRERSLRN